MFIVRMTDNIVTSSERDKSRHSAFKISSMQIQQDANLVFSCKFLYGWQAWQAHHRYSYFKYCLYQVQNSDPDTYHQWSIGCPVQVYTLNHEFCGTTSSLWIRYVTPVNLLYNFGYDNEMILVAYMLNFITHVWYMNVQLWMWVAISVQGHNIVGQGTQCNHS